MNGSPGQVWPLPIKSSPNITKEYLIYCTPPTLEEYTDGQPSLGFRVFQKICAFAFNNQTEWWCLKTVPISPPEDQHFYISLLLLSDPHSPCRLVPLHESGCPLVFAMQCAWHQMCGCVVCVNLRLTHDDLQYLRGLADLWSQSNRLKISRFIGTLLRMQ